MHGDEYRARGDGLQQGLTVADLRRRVRELKADKGLDITLEQRLAYLADLAGVDLEGAFEKKAERNEDREW